MDFDIKNGLRSFRLHSLTVIFFIVGSWCRFVGGDTGVWYQADVTSADLQKAELRDFTLQRELLDEIRANKGTLRTGVLLNILRSDEAATLVRQESLRSFAETAPRCSLVLVAAGLHDPHLHDLVDAALVSDTPDLRIAGIVAATHVAQQCGETRFTEPVLITLSSDMPEEVRQMALESIAVVANLRFKQTKSAASIVSGLLDAWHSERKRRSSDWMRAELLLALYEAGGHVSSEEMQELTRDKTCSQHMASVLRLIHRNFPSNEKGVGAPDPSASQHLASDGMLPAAASQSLRAEQTLKCTPDEADASMSTTSRRETVPNHAENESPREYLLRSCVALSIALGAILILWTLRPDGRK
ncbi:MAG: hypothetical protein HYY93_02720 [Planctomycetes bacterium]|nr:hypothetical protein [Planctomycetota bacterium]